MARIAWGKGAEMAIAAFLIGLTSFSCQSPGVVETKDSLDITVSILPQRYFVEKIGGDRVKVNVMVDSGTDPHIYEPKPQQLQALSNAEAYIKVGVGLEDAWLKKFKSANPNLVMIDSSQSITPLTMEEHNHGHDDDHGVAAESNDPHIWLSPTLAKVQAQNIYEGLVAIDSENKDQYKANLEKFLTEIEQLDQEIRQNLAGLNHRTFIVFHPAWGYFAKDYQLTQIPIEVEGQEPSAKELADVIKTAKAQKIRVIFAQPQFSPKSAETIAQEIQGEVILIDDLAADWSDNLREVSQELAQNLAN